MAWRLRTSAIRNEIANLDPEKDHVRIVRLFTAHEFMWDSTRSLELALFRTFAAPPISALLDRTRQFADFGQKRYDDTTLLILAIIRNGYDSPAGKQAIEQMNAIHGRYKIPNEDLLFVLSTFVIDPIRWIDRYGWRPPTTEEKQSLFLVWKNIAHRMKIRDVPETLEEMQRESDAYVRAKFKFSESNVRVAEAAIQIVQRWLPRWLRNQVKPTVCALLDDATLAAFGFERPNQIFQASIKQTLRARALTLQIIDPAPVPIWPDGKQTYPKGYQLNEIGPESLLNSMRSEVAGAAMPEDVEGACRDES